MALSPDYPIFNGVAPINDPNAVRLAIVAPASGSADVSLGPLIDADCLTTPQTVFIDNRNAGACAIEVIGSQHTIQLPPQSQGFFPLFFGDSRALRVSVTGGGNVNLYILNVYVDPFVWSVDASGATVTIAGQPIDVEGANASGSADTRNPLKAGARFNATRPTFTDGQVSDLQSDARGNLAVSLFNGVLQASIDANGNLRTQIANGANIATVDASGNLSAFALGNVASGAADSGNPLKMGARYNAARPTFADGNRGDLQIGTRGSLAVTLFGSDSVSAPIVFAAQNDATANANASLATSNFLYVFNGATWDRVTGSGTRGIDVTLKVAAIPTCARSSVAALASDTLLLVANTSRRGATVYNDSTALLYLGLGATATSATSFTAQLPAGAYYEIPFGFTGEIRGIWASATGNARVSEMT